jgi:hypothetical protein
MIILLISNGNFVFNVVLENHLEEKETAYRNHD